MSDEALIAIVDDDESVRVAMGGMVESFGYASATFQSADDFLNSSQLPGASCLILDVQMDGISGLELHARLLATGHRIPTIFMTAFPEARTRERALRAGAVCFLAKPFGRDDLLGCIENALGKQAP
ncbi:response regulator transcription factor [Bradyrhizobium campsiandrae]|uniref:response regulator transcription factor n=1 Tax=Bradyrhizobium campsiandrae TaxID=1729892 RepID=UPI001FCE77B1|nr:response regulator [Bradyrhizobium campsiandrae]